MKRTLVRLACCSLASLCAIPAAFPIELSGSSPNAATAVASPFSQAGTVVKIDLRSGELVLDGARRFTFSPGGGVVVRRANGAPANLAEVKVGTSVRLTAIRNRGYASAPVSELWLVE